MPVVTELVIDSAKAVSGSADYSRAMDAASSAAQRGLGAISDFATQAKNSITNLGSAAASMGPSLSTMAIGVTAAAAAFMAGFEAIKKMTAGLAEMGLSARRANLDVEVFQKLQFATGVGGLSNKDFSSGSEKLATNLSEALRSGNDMSKLLDANNVKWKDGNKLVLDTNGLLNVARDLIHRAGDEQQKIKMAEMLGLTKDWVPALDKSAQAFAGLQEEASALGLVISRDTIEKAKQFDDEWRKSSEVFSTWMKSKLADLLPLLDELIAKAGEFKQSVMSSLDAAAASPAGQEFTARTNRAAAIMEMASAENSAKENADILASAAKALAGTLSETTAKLLDQQIAVKGVAKFWNDYAASLDGAAAAGEKLVKTLPTGANDNKVKPSVLPDKEKSEASKDALDRSIESVKRHTALTIANTDAVGLGAAALAEFRTQAELVEAAGRAGIEVTQKWRDKFDDLAADAGQAAQALAQKSAEDKASFSLQIVGLGAVDQQIAQVQKSLHGDDWKSFMNDGLSGTMRLTEGLKEAKQAGAAFATTMIQGLASGASGAKTLSTAMTQLSNTMLQSAMNNPTTGGTLGWLPAIAMTIGSALFGANQQQKEQEHKDAIALIDRASQLQVRQIQATTDQSTLGGQLALFDKQANIQRMNEDRAGGAARNELERTLSQERLKIINDFTTQAAADEKAASEARLAAQREIDKRIQGFQDRLLAATTDQTTLQGQLTILDRQAQRERESEVASGGQALVDLEAAQAAERFNTIKKFNDQIVDDAKKTAQEQLDAQTKAARGIVDYLNNLRAGPESSLSPQDRLNAAQSTYNSILALAQSGNIDALGRITSDFENLRKAAQDFYASGAGYQNILSTGTAQLAALPAVAASTDPIVQAIQGTTAAVQADTTATVAQFNIAIGKFADAVTYLSQAVNQLVTSNSILTALQGLQTTASAQLVLLNANLASHSFSGQITYAGVTSSISTTNTLLDALNKIVINTYAISLNTWSLAQIQAQGAISATGVLAGGGWITGGTPNRDSVLLGSRTAIGMPGEFVVRKDVAQANAGWLPSFNQTNQLPRGASNDNAIDYRPHFAGLDRTNAKGFSELARRLERIEDAIYGGAEKTAEAVKQAPAQRPGVKSKAA